MGAGSSLPVTGQLKSGLNRGASGARRQVELGVLERLLDRRNAGSIARLALLDADLCGETLRWFSQSPILVEIGLVLGNQRRAVLGVARLRERGGWQREGSDGKQALHGSVHGFLRARAGRLWWKSGIDLNVLLDRKLPEQQPGARDNNM